MTQAVNLAAVGTNANSSGTLLISGTAVAASSAAVDFTGIPATAKRVTVMFNGLSTTSGVNFQVQIGDSEGIENTGYIQFAGWMNSSSGNGSNNVTTGFAFPNWSPAAAHSGMLVLANLSGNTWTAMGISGVSNGGGWVGGGKTLSNVLDRVRFTTLTADTFDAGTINIMWE